jgi:hypothetical protein
MRLLRCSGGLSAALVARSGVGHPVRAMMSQKLASVAQTEENSEVGLDTEVCPTSADSDLLFAASVDEADAIYPTTCLKVVNMDTARKTSAARGPHFCVRVLKVANDAFTFSDLMVKDER